MEDYSYDNQNPQPMGNSGYPGFQPDLPNATTVLILGIVSIVGACFCFGIVGIICGAIALSKHKKDNELYMMNPENYSQSSFKNLNTGRICAIIGLILGILSFVFGIIYFAIVGIAGLSEMGNF